MADLDGKVGRAFRFFGWFFRMVVVGFGGLERVG